MPSVRRKQRLSAYVRSMLTSTSQSFMTFHKFLHCSKQQVEKVWFCVYCSWQSLVPGDISPAGDSPGSLLAGCSVSYQSEFLVPPFASSLLTSVLSSVVACLWQCASARWSFRSDSTTFMDLRQLDTHHMMLLLLRLCLYFW